MSSSMENRNSVRSTVQNIQLAYGSPPNADLYDDVLQCSSKASPRTVQQSFFNRRNELFTQINAGFQDAETKMDAVVMAFRLLENPDQRNEYDLWREAQGVAVKPPTTQTQPQPSTTTTTKTKNNVYSRHTVDYDQDEIPSHQYSPHEESFTSTAPVGPQEDDQSTLFSTHFSEAFGIPTPTTPSATFIPSVFTKEDPPMTTTSSTKVTRVVTPPQEQLKKKKKHSSSPSRSAKSSPKTSSSTRSSPKKKNSSATATTTRTVKSTTSSKKTTRSQPGRIIVTSPSDERGFRHPNVRHRDPDSHTDEPDTESYTDEGTMDSSVWTTDDETATQTLGSDTVGSETIDTREEDLYRQRKKQNWKANSHKLASSQDKQHKQPSPTAYPGPNESWTGARVAGVIKEEVEGAYADTCSAFDQVFNVFTLNDKDIKAVSGRITKAKKDFFTN